MDESKLENGYVLVDLRSVVGNCVSFWAEGCSGYTCELDKAHVFTEEAAFRQHQCRPEVDQPIPLKVAREFAVTHVRREPLNRWIIAHPDPRREDPRWAEAARIRAKEEAADASGRP